MTNEEAMYIISECFLNEASDMADRCMAGEVREIPGRKEKLTETYLRQLCLDIFMLVDNGR